MVYTKKGVDQHQLLLACSNQLLVWFQRFRTCTMHSACTCGGQSTNKYLPCV